LKGLPRTLEKAIQDYSKKGDKFGGLGKVIDIVRGSIICKTVEGLKSVMHSLETDPRVTIRRFKNLFRDLDPSHFRRFSYNIELQVSTDDGVAVPHIAEIQIHLDEYFAFKKSNEDLCHKPYEFFREAGKKDDVMPRLQRQMDTMYSIARTPVLLSLFCTTVEATDGRRPSLPTSLHELYASALTKRLGGNESLRAQLQKIAFDNFVCENRREFTLEDMKLSNPGESLRMDLRKKIPMLKVLDFTKGLLQFSHLSFQEALAVAEAQARAPTGALENEAGQFLQNSLFSPKAVNFLQLCPEDIFHFPEEMNKNNFRETFSPQDFLQNLGDFVRPCKVDTLRKLDLSRCSLQGSSLANFFPSIFVK
jgi:hypothetical protein